MLTDKIHYQTGQKVALTAAGPVKVQFGLDDGLTAQGSFTPPEPGGYEVADGAGNTSVFTVSDNVFDVGIGGNWGADQQTNFAGKGKWQGVPAECVAAGVNLFELFFCAPCDFSQLVGTGAWCSGQARYAESDSGILRLVSACHGVGVAVGLYVNCHPCGPAGYALTQAHPEFFLRDGFGNIDGGPADLADYARWNDLTWTGVPTWAPFSLDLTNPNVIQYGIAQIQAAVSHYGFDYVRFDGHYTVAGRPNASITNMLAVRQQLAGKCLVGFNFGRGGDITSEGAVALADGGLYLQELGASVAERDMVNGLGGSYYTLTAGDPFAHPYYANLPAATGMFRWTPAQSAFARRWFPKFVWNRDLSPVGVGSRIKCLVDGVRRYYVTELASPGTYQLGRATNVITPEHGLQQNVSTAVVASIGLVVDEFAPVDPVGVIRCPAFRGYSGDASPIGGDGRQVRSDLSTGVYPFLGVTAGPFKSGTYRVAFNLWMEPGSSGQFTFQVEPAGGKPLLSTSLTVAPVGSYQTVQVGTIAAPDGAMLNASCWPAAGSKGAAHLDSVSFTPV